MPMLRKMFSKKISTGLVVKKHQKLVNVDENITPNKHFDGFVLSEYTMKPWKNNIGINVLVQIPEEIFEDKSLFACSMCGNP